MKEKTPQEKKALSYAKDRRNAYGANDKASRNSIPKRKAGVNRAYRKKVSDALNIIVGPVDLEIAEEVESVTRSIKRGDWKKYRDLPLGEVVTRNLEARADHAGKGKAATKKAREFVENVEIETKAESDGNWTARAKAYPWIHVTGSDEVRAVEKLKHLMHVAIRNEQGADMRVQMDGESVRPRLTK